MDYKNFIKRLPLPNDFKAPEQLTFEDLVARPLTREDLGADLEAINSSIEVIQRTRGGSWPEKELSEEFDFLDLAWHEREFREATSFAYVVYDTNNRYMGCFYLYPFGVRTELNDNLMQYDVDVSWWVTSEAYKEGYYAKLYKALQQWLATEFPFQKIYYSNKEIPQ